MYAHTAVKWVLVDGRVCRLGTTYNYIVREEVYDGLYQVQHDEVPVV